MSGEKTTTAQDTTTTHKVEPTAEETELNQLLLERTRATQEGTIATQTQGLELAQQMLSGGELPGILGGLNQGLQGDFQTPLPGNIPVESIDPNTGVLSPEMISDLSRQAIEDIRPFFQQQGILDSGVAAEISGRTAGDIRRQVAERNIERQTALRESNRAASLSTQESNLERERAARQFNVGTQFQAESFDMNTLLNLINQAIGGQAQIQQPIGMQTGQLSQNLAGLRSMTGTSQGTSTTIGMNPFLKSFQQTAGKTLGSLGSEKLASFGA